MTRRLATIAAILILSASPALAGRPLTIDDAGTIGQGSTQIEAGVAWNRFPNADLWDLPVVATYGLSDHLQLAIGFGYQWQQARGREQIEDASSWDNIGIGPKWQFAQQENALLDQAIAFTGVIPAADRGTGLGTGHPSYDLTWIGTREIVKDVLAADVNIGYTYTTGSIEGQRIADLLHYGVATRYTLSEHWEPVAEVFAVTPTTGEHETSVLGDVGLRYHVNQMIQLDAAIGTTLSGDGPDVYATTGFTLNF